MARSEEDAVVRLPQGDDIEMSLLGQKNPHKWFLSVLSLAPVKQIIYRSWFVLPGKGDLLLLDEGGALLHLHDAAALRLRDEGSNIFLNSWAVRNCYENAFKSEWIWIPGLRPHHLVVVLCHRGDILPLSSVATAPPLCHHRRGGCPFLLSDAPLPWPSDGPPGLPSAGVLLHREDARLHPLSLHPDTGGAQ